MQKSTRQARDKQFGGKSKNKGHRQDFGRHAPKPKKNAHEEFEALVRVGAKGNGWITLDGGEEITIETRALGTALDGDTVKVRRLMKTGSAEIVGIVKRARIRFVGVFSTENGRNYVAPDNKRVYTDFFIPAGAEGEAKEGDKVQIELKEWINQERDPIAKVIKVLGRPGLHETEMQAITLEAGIDWNFPPSVEKEANDIEHNYQKILAEEIATNRRRDMRDVVTFTIDPDDAKDFDDAISCKEIYDSTCLPARQGSKVHEYEIGIHIADVSFFVRPSGAMDREAQERANSVYLVDRTIPMLPEVLSNNICSLKQGEDRLTYSAIITLDKDAKIKRSWFGRTIIHSNKRFTYHEAQEVLNKKTGSHYKELKMLEEIARNLRKVRKDDGAIEFEMPEVKVLLDKSGKVERIEARERIETQMMIEDLMLLANQEVAKFMTKMSKKLGGGTLYRVHDKPDMERIKGLTPLLSSFGHGLGDKHGNVKAREINRLLHHIVGRPEEDLLQVAILRSMSKAMYSTKNIGHFGLGFYDYVHFTSPIRRYPDVLVHRVLSDYLSDKKISAEKLSSIDRIGKHASEREALAARAERESIKFKQAEYMQTQVGKTFDGIISGVVDWGIYVEELLTKSEGLVPVRSLGNDYFELDTKNYQVVGKRTGKVFRLGDKVRIKVISADPLARQINYELVKN